MLRPIYLPALGLAFCVGCSSVRMTGESVVLIGQEKGRLAYEHISVSSVRSTYRDHLPTTVHYEAGRDYLIDPAAGEIQRTPQSRIPDFSTNILYGKEDFNHGNFPGYGNGKFFAFIDYSFQARHPRTKLITTRLEKTRQKLQSGQSLKIVAFGDSITAGGEATDPSLIFWQRWADELKAKYPTAKIEAINGATGGDTTANGLQRLQAKVLDQKPDVVLIGFGMNDHNREGFGVPLETFAENLRTMIDRIRASTSAEVVLYSTFPPNPKWHFGSHRMEVYADATAKVAQEKGCAFADVYHRWQSIAERKKPEDLLGNNINHPNDFGHWIYLEALNELGL